MRLWPDHVGTRNTKLRDVVVNAMKPQFALCPLVIAAVALLSACDCTEGQSIQTPPDPPMEVRTTHLSVGKSPARLVDHLRNDQIRRFLH